MSITLQRIETVRTLLDKWEVDAMLIGSPHNRRWLSGFTGSFGWLLVSAEKAILGTDFRYVEQAGRQTPEFDLFKWVRADGLDAWRQFLGRETRIGIESQYITLADYATMQQLDGVAWKPLAMTVEPLRDVKDSAEIEQIRAAAAITDFAMAQVHRLAQPGVTERELAWQLEKIMREHGADGLAFETIVASGPNGALPHHRPTDRKLQIGDNITIDMGARLDGYHSDMTRAFYLGDEPDEQFWTIYNLVLSAQQNVLDHLKAGLTGAETDALARDVIAKAGYGANFGHGLGHGVGLFIHEGPRLAATENGVIPAGAAVTVEPGVYIPGWGGVRIEDLVIVTQDGIEVLSKCQKKPINSVRATVSGTQIM
jgi:Xaa-Pro aminopeptidase